MNKEDIENQILEFLTNKKNIACSREIAIALGLAWHTVNTHCLKLQLKGVISGFKLGNMNVWKLYKNEK